MNHEKYYGEGYVSKYINRTFFSFYNKYKNEELARIVAKLGVDWVLDIGCNINPTVCADASLRFIIERNGIDYIGLDLSPSYFDRRLISTIDGGIKTFEKVNGVVGNGLRIPIKDSSFDLIIAADVLEHLPDPYLALKEINRVLSPSGYALIVLPSFYKLDFADFSHIREKRQSSHEEKIPFSAWKEKFDLAGFEIVNEMSRPLGIASGLSYLAWLDDDFIPRRKELCSQETYSPLAELHRKAKNVLSKYDELIDSKILSNQGIKLSILKALSDGNIPDVFRLLNSVLSEIEIPCEEKQVCDEFIKAISERNFDKELVGRLINIFNNSVSDNSYLYLVGNSMLLVLQKTKIF